MYDECDDPVACGVCGKLSENRTTIYDLRTDSYICIKCQEALRAEFQAPLPNMVKESRAEYTVNKRGRFRGRIRKQKA